MIIGRCCVHCGNPLPTKAPIIQRFCNRSCAASSCNRTRTLSPEAKQRIRDTARLTQQQKRLNSPLAVRHCLKCKQEFTVVARNRKSKFCSKPCLVEFRATDIQYQEMIRQIAITRQLGGHTSKIRHNYTNKDGKVIHLHSSYETKYATFLDAHNVAWSRPSPLWWIDQQNVKHRYYPDFLLIDHNVYVDTKNDYLIIKDAYKIQCVRDQNQVTIEVLSKDRLNWLPVDIPTVIS